MTNKELEDYLRTTCPGRKNSRRSAELEADLNISGNELRRRINRLRRDTVPIGSSRDGYFYAVTAGRGVRHHRSADRHRSWPAGSDQWPGVCIGSVW